MRLRQQERKRERLTSVEAMLLVNQPYENDWPFNFSIHTQGSAANLCDTSKTKMRLDRLERMDGMDGMGWMGWEGSYRVT